MSLVKGTYCEMEDRYNEQFSELLVSLKDDKTSYLYLGVMGDAKYVNFINPICRTTDMFEMYTNLEMPRGLQ